jgi:UTP--glucose-1-phosphate uridylyltransferase
MDQVDKYGIIDGTPMDKKGNIYRVTNMIEKPSSQDAPSNMAIIYHFASEAIFYMQKMR